MNSQHSASARRSKQLQELLDGKHYKQALNLCEKGFKKGDKSEDLLVTWVNILLGHPDQARREQGSRELDEILGRTHPISETEALVALNNAAKARNDDDPRIQTIWERAVSVRQGDEDLYRTWFKTKFLEGKWTAAQKAAMMYMKKFPLNREPFFWNIITCELAGTHKSPTETDQKILRQLAYRFISKAAADVSAEKPASSNFRALNSLEDIFLLLKVYRSQERYAEALEVLDDPLTGITSRLSNNSWELVRQKIELYELCHLWNEEWQFCAEILKDAHPDYLQNKYRYPYHPFGKFGDDWKVWVGLLSATDMINTSENSEVTKQLIKSYNKPRTISRNARLALLRYFSTQILKNAQAQEELLSACREYFMEYCAKVICFRDLQPYVLRLEKPLREKFLGLVARDTKSLVCSGRASQSERLEWVTSEINVLKLDYYLFVSLESTPNRIYLLRAFVKNCLRLYKVSLSIEITIPVSERRPGDDAAMLAVMALLKLHHLGDSSVVFQCIAILEFLLADSKHNYDALLTLIRLYMNLGTGSLAIQLHSRLSVRNLQHATISWVLYTRISTIHPYASTSTSSNQTPIDSSKNLSLAIDWHKSAEDLNSVSINRMLDNGQYSMLFDVLETDRSIKSGLAKFMFVAESHRIGRFSNFSEIKDYSSLLDEIHSSIEDTRDTTAFPDAEADGQPKFEAILTWAPKPDHTWLKSQLRLIDLWRFFQTNLMVFRDWSFLGPEKDSRARYKSLTYQEARAVPLVDLLIVICTVYKVRVTPYQLGVDRSMHELLEHLKSWFSSMNENLKHEDNLPGLVPFYLSRGAEGIDWQYFHGMFTLLDILQPTIQALNFAVVENPNFKIVDQAHLEAISFDVKEKIDLICARTRDVASGILHNLRVPGTAAKMVENALESDENLITHDLKALIGMPGLEEIAAKLCSSWAEGLEGVLRTIPSR